MTLVTELDLPVLDLGVPEQIRQQVEEALGAGHWLVRIPFGVTVIEHDAVLVRTPSAEVVEPDARPAGPCGPAHHPGAT